jgi:trehalose utilization protein
MAIRALVWNENRHEQTSRLVQSLYPEGIHGAIASALEEAGGIVTTTATLDEPEHGLSAARLAETDVLLWWGHAAHREVSDEVVERVQERVWEGMGLIVLHSGHFSKIFKRLMGTPCALSWREAGEIERLWVLNPNHPITQGLPPFFEIEHEEMYGEPFTVPEPMETLLISWFEGGEVFRSGLTYQRGAGRIFYFRPGHEAYPTYHDGNVRKILGNAVKWAHNPTQPWKRVNEAPNTPPDKAPVPVTVKGPRLHKDGEEGYR